MYCKNTSIRHFEQCNQQLSNPICQNCDGSIKILLDVGNSNMQCNHNSFIKLINFHGFFRNALRCRKTGACRILVPLRYMYGYFGKMEWDVAILWQLLVYMYQCCNKSSHWFGLESQFLTWLDISPKCHLWNDSDDLALTRPHVDSRHDKWL